MPLDFVSTTGAPKAIGPYSQAVTIDGLIFTAGQVALDPSTGELVGGGIAEQTARALQTSVQCSVLREPTFLRW